MTDTPKTEISLFDAYHMVGKPHEASTAPFVVTGAVVGTAAVLGNAYRINGRINPIITLPFVPLIAGCGIVLGALASDYWKERETRRRMAKEHPEYVVGQHNGKLLYDYYSDANNSPNSR